VVHALIVVQEMFRLRNLLLIWALIAIVLGFVASQIPWGDPDGFHGTGFPFAVVYWDYIGDADHPVDYPNPYAPLLNSAAFMIVGSFAILAIYGLVAAARKLHSNRAVNTA
jgi:hypothetical protein